MRQLASFFVCLGVLAAAALALAPTSVPVEFGSGACGPPIVRQLGHESSSDTNRQKVIERCEDSAATRIRLAVVVVVLALIAGLITWIGARRREAEARAERYRRRQRALAEAAAAARAEAPDGVAASADRPEDAPPPDGTAGAGRSGSGSGGTGRGRRSRASRR